MIGMRLKRLACGAGLVIASALLAVASSADARTRAHRPEPAAAAPHAPADVPTPQPRANALPPEPATFSLPFCPGFQIVTAVAFAGNDYESIKTVEAIDGTGIAFRYSSEALVLDMFAAEPPRLQQTVTSRRVSHRDFDNAMAYLQHFDEVLPLAIPETTSNSISRQLLMQLRQQGQAEMGVFIPFNVDRPGIDRDIHPNVYDNQMVTTVTRVASEPFAVTVNGAEVALPTIAFAGDFYGDRAEFVVLDDPINPLMLAFRIGIDANAPLTPPEIEMRRLLGWPTEIGPDKETLRVVEIVSPCVAEDVPVAQQPEAAPFDPLAGALEAALATDGRATLQAIYFTVGSAELRAESDPALAAIAAVLAQHPDWRFAVEGHTDGHGEDTYNLDLSRRRAEAVRVALIERFDVAPARLEAVGFGESRPIADNDTLEGRAQNRRVELARLP